jgi:hypothetical protein
MRSKIHLAALAATFLVFSWQPVLAQDDEDDRYEQQQRHEEEKAQWQNDCVDDVTANMDNPAALSRYGINPRAAEFLGKLHDYVLESFAKLVQMQRYIDTLDGVKIFLSGKKDSKARQIIDDLQDNVRRQMESLRGSLNSISYTAIEMVASRCQHQYETEHRDKPSISFGFGVDTNVEGGGHHHHHHHKGCAVQQ